MADDATKDVGTNQKSDFGRFFVGDKSGGKFGEFLRKFEKSVDKGVTD